MTTKLTAIGLIGFGLVACGGERAGAEAGAEGTPGAAQAAPPATPANPLLNPTAMTDTAPGVYRVKFETTKGDFIVEVTRAWAPNGADRFYNLVKNGFYDEARFFRVVPGFVVQFGIHADPAVSAQWRGARIQDDPVKESNRRGTITFATSGLNSRTTQVFINYGNNTSLDTHPSNFAPFGRVVQGMDVVDKINSEYGEAPSQNQGMIQMRGNAFLAQQYPRLDYIKKVTVVQ